MSTHPSTQLPVSNYEIKKTLNVAKCKYTAVYTGSEKLIFKFIDGCGESDFNRIAKEFNVYETKKSDRGYIAVNKLKLVHGGEYMTDRSFASTLLGNVLAVWHGKILVRKSFEGEFFEQFSKFNSLGNFILFRGEFDKEIKDLMRDLQYFYIDGCDEKISYCYDDNIMIKRISFSERETTPLKS